MDDLLKALNQPTPTPTHADVIDQQATKVMAFLALKWQEDNQQAAEQIMLMQTQLAPLQEDNQYLRQRLDNISDQRARDYEEIARLRAHNQDLKEEVMGHRLQEARLKVTPEVLDGIAKEFFPYNKIPAIKALRQINFIGLKEAKDIIDEDWAHRHDQTNMDEAHEALIKELDQEEPVTGPENR